MVELCVSCATTFINQVWKIVVIIFRGWNRKYIADAQVVHSKEISDNNVKKEKKNYHETWKISMNLDLKIDKKERVSFV